jgi:hypothetical protein
MFIDVFNGDADGICALHQLRLAKPRPEARLVTGVKRDIQLLRQLSGVSNASITVLDISLDSNREELVSRLESGCEILYIDHHYSGELPDYQNLTAHIDPSPDSCTSLIVNRLFDGEYGSWAVAGAFGDNLHQAAMQAAAALSLSDSKTAKLKELGELLNYNGYGHSEADLLFHPVDLYKAVSIHPDPIPFVEESYIIRELRDGYKDDMQKAESCSPVRENDIGRIFELPSQAWARRVSGVFSNLLAREEPDLAHGMLSSNPDGTYRVSVRAPLNNKKGADDLCRAFATGGGRAAAAGINSLPADELDLFFKTFDKVFGNSSQ